MSEHDTTADTAPTAENESIPRSVNDGTADEIDTDEPEPGFADGRGLKIANPEDIFFTGRDENDEPESVPQKVPGREVAVEVVPPPQDRYNEYLNPVDYDDDAKLAELFNKSFPDLERDLTAEDIANDLLPFGAGVAVDCIERAAGRDMKDAMDERQIEQMMKLMGGDEGNVDMRQLVELGEERTEQNSSTATSPR